MTAVELLDQAVRQLHGLPPSYETARLADTLTALRATLGPVSLDGAFADVTATLAAIRVEQGADLCANAPRKCVSEAIEFWRAGTPGKALGEAADVLITVRAAGDFYGWSNTDLAGAVSDKCVVLRGRRWVRMFDGTYQHAPDAGDGGRGTPVVGAGDSEGLREPSGPAAVASLDGAA